MLRTTHNQNYWTLSPQEKVTFHLPQFFPKNFYDPLLKFMGIRPIYNPPHVQDLMGDEDVISNSSGLNVENPIDVNVYKKENINLEIPIQCKSPNIQLELHLHGRPSCSNTSHITYYSKVIHGSFD